MFDGFEVISYYSLYCLISEGICRPSCDCVIAVFDQTGCFEWTHHVWYVSMSVSVQAANKVLMYIIIRIYTHCFTELKPESSAEVWTTSTSPALNVFCHFHAFFKCIWPLL